MILKGSQRGGAANLALHLMNDENEHVTLHEMDGFVADDLFGAMHETDAIASGTKCKQFLFSLSINPPQHHYVSVDELEDAANRAGERLGLNGQPRAIVIHEKEGRRHAHVVWSRIDAVEMKAINLDFFKNRLVALSKELYLERDWELPNGLKENGWKNPLNFTLDQWQQAKRIGLDPREIKQIFRQAWERSDGAKAFAAALEQSGYYLAKGDRRGFVAVGFQGEVYSVSRWCGVKTKDVKLKLGDPDRLPSVDERKAELRSKLTGAIKSHISQSHERQKQEMVPLVARRAHMIHTHRRERIEQREQQDARNKQEQRIRQNRLRSGLAGLWDHLTGKAAEIKQQNERESYRHLRRDKAQRENLFIAQMKERKAQQRDLRAIRDRHRDERLSLTRHVAELLSRKEAVRSRNIPSRARSGPRLER